jgi:cellulose synthase/poly-beta-1,6-N-acetylglucosamine synthase-like glycosyltransferase
MSALTMIVLSIIIVYGVSSLMLLWGTLRQRPQRVSDQPFVSVLIAARNEETRIGRCLDSLLRSQYPASQYEILIIDDRSVDRTREVAENFGRVYSQVKVIPITHRIANMSGKASALCQGLRQARGEIILMTDADCEVPPNWMPQMISYFAPHIGLVGGFTLLTRIEKKSSVFAKIQTLDWIYLLSVGAGAAGLGKPVSILGNNFAFRRAAYEAVGGYEALGFSIIEDFALMRAIHKQTPWQICFPLDPQLVITSEPELNWRDFFEQRQRWAAGGKEVGLLAKAFMLIAFWGHVACLTATFISIPLMLSCLLTLTSTDFLLLWRSMRRLERTDLLAIFPLFEIYYFLYSFLFAPTVLLPTTVRWKGLRYHWNLRGKIKRVEEIEVPS